MLQQLEGLGEKLARIKTSVDMDEVIRETPSSLNNVNYPQKFRNRVMKITATQGRNDISANIIIATQSKGYTEEMFNEDVSSTCTLFGLDKNDKTKVIEAIFLKSVNKDEEVLGLTLDSAKATKQIRDVVDVLNSGRAPPPSQEPHERVAQYVQAFTEGKISEDVVEVLDAIKTTSMPWLRIVSLGVKSSDFVYQSFEYLLNEWNAPSKNVQFVTNGETNDHGFLMFWKSACIMELCSSVEYVKLTDYLPFGYFKGKCKRLYKMK